MVDNALFGWVSRLRGLARLYDVFLTETSLDDRIDDPSDL